MKPSINYKTMFICRYDYSDYLTSFVPVKVGKDVVDVIFLHSEGDSQKKKMHKCVNNKEFTHRIVDHFTEGKTFVINKMIEQRDKIMKEIFDLDEKACAIEAEIGRVKLMKKPDDDVDIYYTSARTSVEKIYHSDLVEKESVESIESYEHDNHVLNNVEFHF